MRIELSKDLLFSKGTKSQRISDESLFTIPATDSAFLGDCEVARDQAQLCWDFLLSVAVLRELEHSFGCSGSRG